MSVFVATPLFTLVGVVVLLVALLAFNLTVPYRVVGDAEHGNVAAAWVTAGLVVSQAIIIRAALARTRTLVDFIILSCFGIVVDIVAYHLLHWLAPGWSLNRAIHENQSVAAGVLAAGALVAAGLVVAGAMS